MSKTLKIYRAKFKGIEGVGLVGGVDEDAARRLCKRYPSKLISLKYDHTETFEGKKKKKEK